MQTQYETTDWLHHPGRGEGLTYTEWKKRDRRESKRGAERCGCGKVKGECLEHLGKVLKVIKILKMINQSVSGEWASAASAGICLAGVGCSRNIPFRDEGPTRDQLGGSKEKARG